MSLLLLLLLPLRRQLREENLIASNNDGEQQPALQSELAVICKEDLLNASCCCYCGRQAVWRVFVYPSWFQMGVSLLLQLERVGLKPAKSAQPSPLDFTQSVCGHQGRALLNR